MKTFETIDISGDAGIRAYGITLEELFINAATGMYSLITDPGPMEEKKEVSIAVESHSLEGLLVSWLNELIFHFDTYGFVGKSIRIENVSDYHIAARISGEEFDPDRHEGRLLVKAATYHQLRIEKQGEEWAANIIFDI